MANTTTVIMTNQAPEGNWSKPIVHVNVHHSILFFLDVCIVISKGRDELG